MALAVKNLLANTGRCKRRGFSSGVEKIPWRRAWKPTPVFLSRDSYGKRSLVVSTGLQRVAEHTCFSIDVLRKIQYQCCGISAPNAQPGTNHEEIFDKSKFYLKEWL